MKGVLELKTLSSKRKGLRKLVAMMGGFMIFIGIVLLGIAFLGFFGYFNVSILLERKYLLIFAFAMVIVGLLDSLTAIIMARW